MGFPEIKPGGWSAGETLTPAQITIVQSYLTRAVVGDGDTVSGPVTFARLIANNLVRTIQHEGPYTVGDKTIAWDCDAAGILDIARGVGAAGTVEITMTNLAAGGTYFMISRSTTPASTSAPSQLVFDMDGVGGITHLFDGGNQDTGPQLGPANKGSVIWQGLAVTTTLIFWWQIFASRSGPNYT